jgi:hypothetical protein
MRWKVIAVVVVVMGVSVLVSLLARRFQQPGTDSLPGYRPGINPADSAATVVEPSWIYETGEHIGTVPAVGPDGSIYAGTKSGVLHAVTPDGQGVWQLKLPEYISAISTGADGKIFMMVGYKDICAASADGKLLWTYRAVGEDVEVPDAYDGTQYSGNCSAPVPGPGGVVYTATAGEFGSRPVPKSAAEVGSLLERGFLHAIDASGKKLWSWESERGIPGEPALDAEGNVYVAGWDQHIHGFTPDGTEILNAHVGREMHSIKIDAASRQLYVSDDQSVDALALNGTPLWSVPINIRLAAVVTDAAGTVYLAGFNGEASAFDMDGKRLWSHRVDREMRQTPALVSDALICLGASRWVALSSASGEELCSFKPGFENTPCAGPDGQLYAAASGTKLCRYDLPGTAAVEAAESSDSK